MILFELVSPVNFNMGFIFTSRSLINMWNTASSNPELCSICLLTIWCYKPFVYGSWFMLYLICWNSFLHNFEIILQNLYIKSTIIFCRFCMQLKTWINRISQHDIYMKYISISLFSLRWIRFILSIFIRLSCIQMLSERIILFFSRS